MPFLRFDGGGEGGALTHDFFEEAPQLILDPKEHASHAQQ